MTQKDNKIILSPSSIFIFVKCFKFIILICAIIFAANYFSYKYIEYLSFIPLVIMTYWILYYRLVRYVVTEDQILYKRGIFVDRTDYLEMYRVKDQQKYQPLLLKILGVMHLELQTSDKTHPTLKLEGIPNSNFPEILRDLTERSRHKNKVREFD